MNDIADLRGYIAEREPYDPSTVQRFSTTPPLRSPHLRRSLVSLTRPRFVHVCTAGGDMSFAQLHELVYLQVAWDEL